MITMALIFDPKTNELVNLEDSLLLSCNDKKEEPLDKQIIKSPCNSVATIPMISYAKLAHSFSNSSLILGGKSCNIFCFKAGELPSAVFSNGFFNTSNRSNIRISCEMRSIGATESNVYIAIDCFTKPYDNPEYSISCGRGGVILNKGYTIRDIYDNYMIELNVPDTDEDRQTNYEIFKQYNSKVASINLAIFYDGTVDKLPDHLVTCNGNQFLFGLAKNMLTLHQHALPSHVISEIIFNKTIIRLHQAGGYVYPLGNFSVPPRWTTYSVNMHSVGNYSKNNTVLRMGTKYIKVGLLTNYNQNNTDAELLVRNFTVCELE